MVVRQSEEPGINAFRFALMFTVVMAHAWFLFGPTLQRNNPSYLLLITAQCSVPAFFIISGYFVRWREADPFAVTRWALRKLLTLYFLWIAIYALVTGLIGWGAAYVFWAGVENGNGLLQLLRDVAFGASIHHLWFLPALAIALSATSLSLRLLGHRWTWVLAGLLAAAGLLTGPYQVFFGLEGHSIRAQFLTAPALVMVGIHIAEIGAPRRLLLFALATLAAYWLQVLDDRWLATAASFGATKARPAVTLATIPFALFAFLLARSLPRTPSLEWVSQRKNYLTVIYCIHPMILQALKHVWDQKSLGTTLVAAVIGFALSLLAAVAVSMAHQRWRGSAHTRRPLAIEAGQQ